MSAPILLGVVATLLLGVASPAAAAGAWVARPDGADYFTTWPVISGDEVFASSGGGMLAVDAGTGLRLWYSRFEEGQSMTAPAVTKERVLTAIPGGRLAALDRFDGRVLWRLDFPDEVTSATPAGDELVLVGTREALTAIDPNGHEIWTFSTGGLAPSTPAVDDGRVFVTLESLLTGDAALVALDSDDGRELWRVAQVQGTSSPAVGGGKVVIGGGDFAVRAFRARSGETLWTSRLDSAFTPRTRPAISAGSVYAASRSGIVYAFEVETGRRLWKFSRALGTFDQSFPVVSNGSVLIGSGAGWAYGLRAESGDLQWKEQVGGYILSGAADEERFFFGVKFRNEGLHGVPFRSDPASGPTEEAPPIQGLINGAILFVIAAGGVLALRRLIRVLVKS